MIEVILGIGLINGFILGLILIQLDTANRNANIIFGVIVIIVAFIIGESWYIHANWQQAFPHLLRTTDGLLLILMPLLYLYSLLITGKKRRINWRDLLHLLPFLFFTILLIPYYSLYAEAKLIYSNSGEIAFSGYLKALSAAIYFPLAIKPVWSTKRHLSRTNKKGHERQNVHSYFVLLLALFSIASISLIMFTLFNLGHHSLIDPDTLSTILLSLLFYWYGFILIKNPFILWGTTSFMSEEGLLPEDLESSPPLKYKNSPLSVEDRNQLLEDLVQCMERERLYLNPDFTPLDFESKSGIKTHYITEVLNVVLEVNFYEFVNRYRIQEVLKQIRNPNNDHKTLLGLALESGFNSKSSFNRTFKKFMGMTPSQYRKKSKKSAIPSEK